MTVPCRFPRALMPLLVSAMLASCANSSGFDVQASDRDFIRFDYSVKRTAPQEMARTAETHCQRSSRHARQIDVAYLRGTDAGDLWRTVTYACTDR